MKTFYFNEEFVGRYKSFLSSKEYLNISGYSKSNYWEHHAKNVGVEINGTKIIVNGVSGFYIPSKRGKLNKTFNLIKKVTHNPGGVIKYLSNKVRLHKKIKGLFLLATHLIG